jgi:hypothetical protein
MVEWIEEIGSDVISVLSPLNNVLIQIKTRSSRYNPIMLFKQKHHLDGA